MAEDIEAQAGTPGEGTPEADSSYADILAGEGSAPKPESVESGDETNPEQASPEQTQFDPNAEVILEIGGKTFTLKGADAVGALENYQKLSEREKELSEKEKSLNRDYTQKSQANAEFRKSVEASFGRYPEPDELKALGRVYQAYFQSQEARKAIDGILTGNMNVSATPQAGESAQVSALKAELQQMRGYIEQFTNQISERESHERQAESQRLWKSWVDSKDKAGIKITDEIDARMAPYVSAIKQAHSDWDANRILDEAYRHANIDQIEKGAMQKAIVDADKAKKMNPPRITPKGSQKADSELSYAEIIQSAI